MTAVDTVVESDMAPIVTMRDDHCHGDCHQGHCCHDNNTQGQELGQGNDLQGQRLGRGRLVFARHYKAQMKQSDGGGDTDPFCRSCIRDINYTYPLKLMVPEHASSSVCQWVYPLTFGGGLVEGDTVELEVDVQQRCAALITTQASTKVYHCPSGQPCTQVMRYSIASHALLAVLPDPMVCYKDAVYTQKQVVEMTVESNLILLDWHTAGRVARGEIWDFTRYSSSNTISVGGSTVFRDAVVIENSRHLSIKQAMKNYQVFGMCVILGPYLAPHAQSLLKQLGKPKSYGAQYENDRFVAVSPLSYDLNEEGTLTGCVIRFAAQETSQAFEELEKILQPLYGVLGGNPFENKY